MLAHPLLSNVQSRLPLTSSRNNRTHTSSALVLHVESVYDDLPSIAAETRVAHDYSRLVQSPGVLTMSCLDTPTRCFALLVCFQTLPDLVVAQIHLAENKEIVPGIEQSDLGNSVSLFMIGPRSILKQQPIVTLPLTAFRPQ